MWSSSNFVSSSNETTDPSPIHNIAQYIEDYIDLVENVPNDIIRQITQIHEYNHRYNQLLTTLDSLLEIIANNDSSPKNESKRRKSLLTLQRCLVEIQEISDEKLFIIQTVLDQLDAKARQLDLDYRNVTMANSVNSVVVTPTKSNVMPASSTTNNSLATGAPSDSVNLANNTDSVQVNESAGNKESCSSGGATAATSPNSVNTGSINPKRSSSRRNLNSGRGTDIGNNGDVSVATAKRGVKRGSKGHSKDVKRSKNKEMTGSSPPAIYEETPIDPDEPTYCLCEQVSFGEMIGCDNEACPIEWFHFSCVALTTKPKGKWYCPNCRGDRSNIPKK